MRLPIPAFLILCLVIPAVGLSAQSATNAIDAASVASTNMDPLAALKKLQEKLQLENSISELTIRGQLSNLQTERQRLELENQVAQQKLQAKLSGLQAEIDELTRKNDLAAKKAAAHDAEKKAVLDADLDATHDLLERLKVSNDLATQVAAAHTRDIQTRQQELLLRITELQAERAENDAALAKLNFDLDSQDRREKLKNRVSHDLQYTLNPYTNGVLTISDRRIPLNGVITMEAADDIVEKINYFNNQDASYPIFIVIDASPGGSVMAGYKILKAMEGSSAPVYVVVKSFAASMAAGITTLSARSFAYPNAIVLHHQILTVSMGNLTQQREGVRDLEEWWKRLASPVAAKMGVSLDEFIEMMYKNRSTGDWEEFGDNAKKLKWVDEIVDRIREESVQKNPETDSGYVKPKPGWMVEQTDLNGRRYVNLPRLESVDAWYLYNPDGYYRTER